MKAIFFGTPDYVVPIAQALHKAYNQGREKQFTAVVTQEPKPTGRKGYLTFSAIDDWAHKKGIKVLTNPEDVWESDLGIVASYGKILSKDVIKRFKHGILNIHPSCLPDLRGATPIPASILRGDTTACVTIIKMDEELDHGPILSKFKAEILPTDTTETLRTRLFELSAEFLMELIPSYLSGKINLKSQNHKEATLTRLLKKSDGFIPPQYLSQVLEGKSVNEDWTIRFMNNYNLKPAPQTLFNFVRAMHPWPGAWTTIKTKEKSKSLKILKAHIEDNKLVLDEVHLEGKSPTTWKQFQLGYPEAKFVQT